MALTRVTGELFTANGQRIIDIADPVAGSDAATKQYVDSNSGSGIQNVVEDITPQLGGDLDAQSTYQINNLVDPVLLQQAATKNYVDSQIAGVGGGGGTDTNTVNMTLNADGTAGQCVQIAASGVDIISGGALEYINPTSANHPNTSWNYNDHHHLLQNPSNADQFLSIIAMDGKIVASVGTFDPVTNNVSWSAVAEQTAGYPASVGTADAFAVAIDPNADTNGDHLFAVVHENGTSYDPVIRAGKLLSNGTVSWGNAVGLSGMTTVGGREKYKIDFCNDTTNKHIFACVVPDSSQYPTLFTGSIDPTTTNVTTNNVGTVYSGSFNTCDIEFSPANSLDTAVCVVALAINGISRAASCKLNNFSDLTDVTINATQIPFWSTAHLLNVNWDSDGSGNLYFTGYGAPESSDTETNNIVFITPADVTLGTDTVLSVWRDSSKHVLHETNSTSLNTSYYHVLKPVFVANNKMLIAYMETDDWPQRYTFKVIDIAFNTSSTVYTEGLPAYSDVDYFQIADRNITQTSKGIISAGRDYNDFWVVNEPTTYSNLVTGSDYGILTETGLTGQSKAIQWDGVYTTTGLTAGEKYYVQPDGTFTTNVTHTSVELGVAISSTQLLLNGASK